MPVNPTPAETAAFDQALADATRRIDGFVAAYRRQAAESGRAQATANAAAAVHALDDRDLERSLFLAALIRLAEGGGDDGDGR